MCFVNLHNSNIFCIFVLKYKGYGTRRLLLTMTRPKV